MIMKTAKYILTFALLACVSCSEKANKMPWEDDFNNRADKPYLTEMAQAEVGEVLPYWAEGCLDIHFINAGQGECNFFIMPDGTTLLIDAGEYPVGADSSPRKPNALISPPQVYASYIKHFMPAGKNEIDWCAPSHFHTDHIGHPSCTAGITAGGYALTGLTAVYHEVPFKRLRDLGYAEPGQLSYCDDPTLPRLNGELLTNGDWPKFVNWAVANKGMDAARFKVGEEQIALVHNKGQYPDFKVFNFVGNTAAYHKGEDGNGELHVDNSIMEKWAETNTDPAARYDNASSGNSASSGIHISYGDFDFITSGDLEQEPQKGQAYYYRDCIKGAGRELDVYKAAHHMHVNSWGTEREEESKAGANDAHIQMRTEKFSPRVIIGHSMKIDNPYIPFVRYILNGGPDSWSYAATWKKDLFFTNISEYLENNYAGTIGQLAGCKITTDPEEEKFYNGGHIVVRVVPGGAQYYVYVLDDRDLDYKVKSIHGPYDCE